MARREKLFLGSSLLHSFDVSSCFWTFLSATCCYRMHTKIIKNMLEKLTKMVPKWSQTSPKSILEGVWRPLGSHPWNKMLPRPHFWRFWLHFGTPFGTISGSFWASFFWCFFEVAFWWLWPPFGLPKHLQNEAQKGSKDTSYQKVKIELSLQPELDPEGCGGAENDHIFDVFSLTRWRNRFIDWGT